MPQTTATDASRIQGSARPSAFGALAAAAIALVLLAILAFHLWSTNHQQGQLNRHWLTHYASSVVQVLAAQPELSESSSEFLRLLTIPELRAACLYIDQNLFLQTHTDQQQICTPSSRDAVGIRAATGLSVNLSFKFQNGSTGLLVLAAGDQRPPLLPTLLLSLALVLVFTTCAFCAARWYVRRQQQQWQAQPMEELKQLFQTLHRTQNYRLRAAAYTKAPFKVIAEVVNQMLDELQANENQIHEFAVQIQEKNDQLVAQKRLHQDRNQNLQKMFAGASHDLRQPLQAMLIFVGAIKEHATPLQEPLLQKLEQVVDNLNHLFTDLLDISKLESRMTRIPKQHLAIKPLLAKIYDEFEALANEKRIELRLYNRDLTVFSNPNMLERIIRNMISNAIRYTRTGGVLIGCRKRGNAVWIEVWDTGRGIPQEKMGEIFNEFVQIKDEESESNKGVGLGLFIVKRLAQLLDHTIIVTSQLRRGTMFRVVAPSENVPVPALTPTTVPTPPTPIVQVTRLPHQVLLLDDDDQIRVALKHLLKSWGCAVSDWSRLEDALALLEDERVPVDLIISDFQLDPEIDGLTAIAALREHLGDQVPALIITGTQDTALLEKIEQSQIPFLRKPVRPAKLRAMLQAFGHKN